MQSRRQYQDPMSRTTSYQGVVLETPDFASDNGPIGLPWDEYGDWPWGRVGAGVSLAISLALFYRFAHHSGSPLVLVFALLAANAVPAFWGASEVTGPRPELGRLRKTAQAILIHGSGVFVGQFWTTLPESSRDLFCWTLSAVLISTLVTQVAYRLVIKPQRVAEKQALLTHDQFPRL
jgi:hypothetical protein